ncbi:drug resistance transporter, EmrB/QacA subfamily [Streptosporangium canum]|uniref:Drug resistance transporter, EmrB/QacA subfamily n=1 Tax=Streptosporangium canum TaxID=324952 RepID=A0A1I4D9A1_9ACTN|nr:MFS transporter [Streptosporangium canum]SFK88521.1 drug resistance transporter, EmrB/QacA subfamily [Streptosporangium canum]
MTATRKWWALGAISLATFMTYLDNNVVNVALPTIQRDLGLSISGLEWIVSGYILVFAGLMLVGGRLADVFGRRRIFMIGLGVFTVASLAAGLATDGTGLIAARALQGVGAAFLTPTALALLTSIFPDPRERATAVGMWSAVGALALALGPLTGGFISERWDWGWIYLINVPIGIATFGLGLWAIRVASQDRVRHSLDVPGLVTSSLALSALTYGLIEGDGAGWTSPEILGAFGLAVAAAVTFTVIETRGREPMIDLSLFRSRVFSGGVLSMGLWSFGVFGIYFFTALYLQNALGFSPMEAGVSFVPMALVMAVTAAVASRISGALGTARTVAAGLLLMAVAVFGISFIGEGGSFGDLLPWFLVYGLGGGLLVPLTTAILGTLPTGRAGVASGVLNVSREIFGLLGITVLGAILNGRQTSILRDGAAPLTAFLEAYQSTLVIAAAIVLVGVPVSLFALRTPRTPRTPESLETPAGRPAVPVA